MCSSTERKMTDLITPTSTGALYSVRIFLVLDLLPDVFVLILSSLLFLWSLVP